MSVGPQPVEPGVLPPAPADVERRDWGRWLAEHPLVALAAVLTVLILVTGSIEPDYLSFSGMRNTVLFAVLTRGPNLFAWRALSDCTLRTSSDEEAVHGANHPGDDHVAAGRMHRTRRGHHDLFKECLHVPPRLDKLHRQPVE